MKSNKSIKIIIGILVFVIFLIIIFWFFPVTFSRYQTETESEVNIQYAFYLLKTDYFTEEIKLGEIVPQDEKYIYSFTVANNDGINRLETDLEYDLVITTTTNLPLSYELYLNTDYNDPTNNIITSDVTASDEYGTYFRTLKVNTEYFSYKEDQVNTYYLVVSFPSIYKDSVYQDIVDSVTISIDSKQILPDNN